jgi:RimJ/RimL family protein N-acetyltransferase
MRTSRRCRAIFRIDRFFTVPRYCGENGLEPTTLYDRRVAEFVPPDFDVPLGLETPQFVLEPLGPEHCERDYAAWTSSMDHIRSTPGWSESRWPREMTLDENRADLERHANDFRSRTGFTYTVLDPQSSDVIGCVYIYPLPDGEHDARARSWVRASRADLDTPLWRTVQGWLSSDWPLGRVEYAPRT